MNSDNPELKPVRYRWPWFALAFVILGVVLFFVFLGAEARRVREMRELNPTPTPADTQTNAAADSSSLTNQLLAGFTDVLSGGDPMVGQKIFFEKPEANCAKCHRVAGQGGDTGPALDGTGSKRNREFILEALLYPNLHVTTNYQSVIVVLNSGEVYSGILKSENQIDLRINTGDEGIVTVRKDQVKLRQKGISPMPEGLGQLLSHQDLRDLVAYVASLKN